MQIQLFSIPVFGSQSAVDDMNKFMRANRIIDVEKHLVNAAEGAYWTFCIRYTEGLAPAPFYEKKEKIDYKTVLDAPTFARFEKLREIRKQISESDAVPAYAVFTDVELVDIAKLKEFTLANIQSIKGIGVKKVEKYGESTVHLFNET